MATTVTHATAAVGTDSGDDKVSKDAWNEEHTVALDFGEAGDISTQAFGDAPAAGVSGEIADAAHKHGMPVENLPWTIDINPYMTPITHTNWIGGGTDEAEWADQTRQSSGAQNAEIGWDVVLAAGTWTVEILHVKFTNRGIYSVQFDAVEKGTFDGYNASAAYNQLGSVASIAVTTSGKVRLTLKMATKNASSSSYVGDISWVQLRRTA